MAKYRRYRNQRHRERFCGYVLIELVLVFFIMVLLMTIVLPDAINVIQQAQLDEDVAQFARTLRTTAELAILYGYELHVVIDVMDGYYTVYDFHSKKDKEYDDKAVEGQGEEYEVYYDESENEPLIAEQRLNRCFIEQINLDDGTHQFSGEYILRATPRGWERSQVFNLIDDRDKQQRWVRCDRTTVRVEVSRKPLEIPEPLEEVSIMSEM